MSASKASGLKSLLGYLVNNGQSTIQQLSYAPIPAGLKTKDNAAIDGMRCNGRPIGA
jgi:hypothetical protein